MSARKGLRIGARVRIVSAPLGDEWLIAQGEVAIGDVGTVADLEGGDPPIQVDFDDDHWFFNPENLEVIA